MFEELKGRISGCFYTIFTPFNENESVDFDSLRAYLLFLHERGATKFYAMAYNSRYSQMTPDEIRQFNEFCIRTVKDYDKNHIVIVGDPIHCSTAQSTEFARHARDCGADLISLIVREKYFCDEQIVEHYDTVGRNSGMAILVHEMPFLSGYNGKQMHWPISLFPKLRQVPYIVALKEDAKDFEVTCTALKLEPDIKVIIAGRKSEFIKYRDHGAGAYLNGISIIDPVIGKFFWNAYKNGDSEQISFVLHQLEAPFFDTVVSKYGWHRCNKALLQAAGIMHRRDRMPMPHLNDEEFVEVKNCYSEISSVWNGYRKQNNIS